MATQTNPDGFTYDPVTGTPVDKPTADNAAARWRQIDAKATSAESGSAAALATLGAVKQEAAAAKTAAQQSASSAIAAQDAATDAEGTAERFGDDVELLKQMAQIEPGSVTDAQTALLIQDPESETRSRLNAQVVDIAIPLAGTVGTVNMRKPGDTRAGVYDWTIGSGNGGYLFHIRTTDESVAGEFIQGFGIDAGLGGGTLYSIKGPGTGIQIEQQPGGGPGMVITAASRQQYLVTSIYSKNAGAFTRLRDSEMHTDGLVTAGSTTFTSPGAQFTSADVGRTIQLSPYVQTQFGSNRQRTIAAVTNATTVTLNAPAEQTGAVKFLIIGRPVAEDQVIERVIDTDGATPIYERRRGYQVSRVPFRPADPSNPGLQIKGVAGQAASLFEIRNSDSNAFHVMTPDGVAFFYSTGVFTNAQRPNNTQAALTVRNESTWATSRTMRLDGNDTADQLQLYSKTGTLQSRFDKGGRFITRAVIGPADADLAIGDLAIWFDASNGAVAFKGRLANNTVKTATVPLA